MSQALWMRLREVKWANYQTSTGSAERMPKLLQDLSSRKAARAMRSSQEIWKLLCSGGVHSAAAPSIQFLVDIVFTSTEEVRMEIYDILISCATFLEQQKETEEKVEWYEEAERNLRFGKKDLENLLKKSKGDSLMVLERLFDI